MGGGGKGQENFLFAPTTGRCLRAIGDRWPLARSRSCLSAIFSLLTSFACALARTPHCNVTLMQLPCFSALGFFLFAARDRGFFTTHGKNHRRRRRPGELGRARPSRGEYRPDVLDSLLLGGGARTLAAAYTGV